MLRWLLPLLLTTTLAHAEMFVLVAGVETYDDQSISSLRYAVADAKSLTDAFTKLGVPPGNIITLTSDQQDRLQRPTKFAILHSLQRLREKARADDTLIFFFAGHGMQQNETPYLLTADSIKEQLTGTALPVSMVHDIMSKLEAKNVLFIVDACRNDPTAGRAEGDAKLDESFARDIRLRRLETPGRQVNAAVLLACDVGERAWEMPDEHHGAFTYYLLRGLAGAGKGPDGSLTVGSLAAYVTKEVPAWAQRAGREQTPRFENPGGDFALFRPARRGPVGDAPGGRVEAVRLKAKLQATSTPPGATVVVDGQEVGRTPLEHAFEMQGDRQQVRVELRLEGYAMRAYNVELVAGATQSLTNVELPKLAPPVADVTPIKPPNRTDEPPVVAPAKAFEGFYGGDADPGDDNEGEMRLTLRAEDRLKVTGVGEVDGLKLRLEGTVDPDTGVLNGTVTPTDADFGQEAALKFEARLVKGQLQFGITDDDDQTFEFSLTRRAGTPGPGPRPPPGPRPRTKAPDLSGVYVGPTATIDSPDGVFRLEAPAGWTVMPGAPTGMVLVNPGLRTGELVDAMIAVHHARVEDWARGETVDYVMDGSRDELIEGLAQWSGLVVEDEDQEVELFRVNHGTAGVLQFPGTINGMPAFAWCGALMQDDHYGIISGVLMNQTSARYLPGLKRMLATLALAPPARDRASEAALVGGQFSYTIDSGAVGGLASITYVFAQGGRVSRQVVTGGDNTVSEGTYEVAGGSLYLWFPEGAEQGTLLKDGQTVMGFQLGYMLFTAYQVSVQVAPGQGGMR